MQNGSDTKFFWYNRKTWMIDYSVFGVDLYGDLNVNQTSKCVANKTYFCMELDAPNATKIVKKFHYSKKVVANSKLHLGIFDVYGKLKGCLSFGPPMNGNVTSKKFSDDCSMFELNRMVMDDDQPRNSESCAIGLCIRYLKKFRKDIHWILSFSDGKESNVGYIYQATNWKYLGFMLSDSFYDLDGNIMHSVTVWHNYKESHQDRNVKTTHEILYDNFDNVSKIESKQHIYVMPLTDVKFKQEFQKYPKIETEIPIVRRIIYKKDGIVCDPPITIKY